MSGQRTQPSQPSRTMDQQRERQKQRMEQQTQNRNAGQESRQRERTHQMLQSRTRVRDMQRALNRAGYRIKDDGMMGPRTRNALRHYQRTHGLKATGQPDPETLRRLGVD